MQIMNSLAKRFYGKFNFEMNECLRVKIKKKIVIIESDDWGLERFTNMDGRIRIFDKYKDRAKTRWFFDSLETDYDLDRLFDLLNNYSKYFKYKPIITGNFITHNIDYQYCDNLKFIGLTENTNLPRNRYFAAINNGFLKPQLHGFCHYNHSKLIEYFKSVEGYNNFKDGFFVVENTISGNTQFLHGEYLSQNKFFKEDFALAKSEFENYFGFNSISVIPCTYILDREIEEYLYVQNISIIQAYNRLTKESRNTYNFLRKNDKQKNLRNARLDVHEDYNKIGNIGKLINDMEIAFAKQLPCVIDLHRVNFVSKFNEKNADVFFKDFDYFLNYCKLRHPDIEFLSTPEFFKRYINAD